MAFPNGFVSAVEAIPTGGGGSTEIPKKWERPSNWPNLDLINTDQRERPTAYITILADGTWDRVSTFSSTYAAYEIQLNSDGSETVISTLTVSVNDYGFNGVDISSLSNGIHLIKIEAAQAVYLNQNANNSITLMQKTLEVLFINSNQKVILNTGVYSDLIAGLGATTEHFSAWHIYNTDNGNILGMTYNCSSLKKIDYHYCDFGIGGYLYYGMMGLTSLIEFTLDHTTLGINTSVPSLLHCFLLETFDIASMDWAGTTLTAAISMNNSPFLKNFSGFINYPNNQNYQRCPKLTHQSLINIINALPTTSETRVLTLGTYHKSRLTSDEIAIATAKGWTVA